ncbi:hypothetical protein HDU96_000538 [Phlyctochytrium bullatum]|nr:hypothetical protein HDU96_000538 [Phlyctochytrium bullatum]
MTPAIPKTEFDPTDKKVFYSNLLETVKAVADPSLPLTANLANISSVIYFALVDAPVSRKINWAGFYLTEFKQNAANGHAATNVKQRMVLGPFQGRLACTIIPFGKGVCGTAAAEKRTVVVPDVHEFPGHIACDSASESEIVVPIILKKAGLEGAVAGVLDIDCLEKNGFDDEDKVGLEAVVEALVEALEFSASA